MNRTEIIKTCRNEKIRFIRLQFIDIMGANKAVEIPESQLGRALDGRVVFDGSSIEGFSRIEESDTLLHPDTDTFRVFPWEDSHRGRVARLICDIAQPSGAPFDRCPRTRLKAALDDARKLGFSFAVAPEIEFFLFRRGPEDGPSVETGDTGGYFDLAPIDQGEHVRREVVDTLEIMGVSVEAAHHEVAPGQHEIDLKSDGALQVADHIATFKLVARKVAQDHGLHATFMPKPIHGQSGSGMHLHQTLLRGDGNAFFDSGAPDKISEVARHYIGGLLTHARGICAITNPLINSYKRLVPGFEAPTSVSWSEQHRSPLVRIPTRGQGTTRCELRMPDPSCNPYLALATILKAGLDGVAQKLPAPPPVTKSIPNMSVRERRKHKVESLPGSLFEAITLLKRSTLARAALGTPIFKHFIEAKSQEWRAYCDHVHPWEIDRYLGSY